MLTFNCWLPVIALLYTNVDGSNDIGSPIINEFGSSIDKIVGSSVEFALGGLNGEAVRSGLNDNSGNPVSADLKVVVDKILQSYKLAIITSGNTRGEIKLKDIEDRISVKLLGVFDVEFLATNGSVRNVLTVQRGGPVHVKPGTNRRIIIVTTLRFDYLKVIYHNFVFKLPLMNQQEGKLTVDVRDFTFQMAIEVSFEQSCDVQLSSLKIINFGKTTPAITGTKYKIVDWVAKLIFGRLFNSLKQEGKSSIENYLHDTVTEAIKLSDVCRIFREFNRFFPLRHIFFK